MEYSFLDSSIYIEHIEKKFIILFNIYNMLHPIFIFLLSFTFFSLDVNNFAKNKSYASSILMLPEKRPNIANDYDYSLGTINDMILKEGGKTIGAGVVTTLK